MRFFIPLLLVAALPVSAQQMYRCGTSFSDKPCGTGQQVIGEPAQAARPAPAAVPLVDLPADPATVEAATAACIARLGKDIAFRDPESVKVLRVQRRGLYHVGDGKTPSRIYLMEVNAKNAFGGYTGAKDFFCHTDPTNERTVLLVRPTSY